MGGENGIFSQKCRSGDFGIFQKKSSLGGENGQKSRWRKWYDFSKWRKWDLPVDVVNGEVNNLGIIRRGRKFVVGKEECTF